MKRPSYVAVGALYGLLSLPAWWALVSGHFAERRDPHLLLAFAGAPVAIGFIAFGLGWARETRRSWIALRVSWIGLAFALFLLGSLAGVKAGVAPLMTSVLFCAVAASYLGLVALALLVSTVLDRPERETHVSSREN